MPERAITFTNDLDGVHFKALPSMRAMRRLWQGETALPEMGRPIEEFSIKEGLKGAIYSNWSILLHQLRPSNAEALAGLALFKEAAEQYERKLGFAALSGREKDKHPMTRKRLEATGRMEFFSDLYLNEGVSSTSWKESIVRNLTQQDFNVVHIDDDIRAGLCIARVDEEYPDENRVLVYILKNVSNHPRLLARSGISIPTNVKFVQKFHDAAEDFSARLKRGEL